jgi:hypothetical protein
MLRSNKIVKRELGKMLALLAAIAGAALWGWFLKDGPRDFVAEALRYGPGLAASLAFVIVMWDAWRRRGIKDESGGADAAD